MTLCCCGGGGGGGPTPVCRCWCCNSAIPSKFIVTFTNAMEDPNFDWCVDWPNEEVNDCSIAGTYELTLEPCDNLAAMPEQQNCVWSYYFPDPHSLCSPDSIWVSIYCTGEFVFLDLTVCWIPYPGCGSPTGGSSCLRWHIPYLLDPENTDGDLERINCAGYNGTLVPVYDDGLPGSWYGPCVPCSTFNSASATITAVL